MMVTSNVITQTSCVFVSLKKLTEWNAIINYTRRQLHKVYKPGSEKLTAKLFQSKSFYHLSHDQSFAKVLTN